MLYFVGNSYYDHMIKTYPLGNNYYFNWDNEDYIWAFNDYGLWQSVNREDLENNLKENNNEI